MAPFIAFRVTRTASLAPQRCDRIVPHGLARRQIGGKEHHGGKRQRAKVTGSLGDKPQRSPAITRATPSAAISPMPRPIAPRRAPSPITRRTPAGVHPSAMRTPISRLRSVEVRGYGKQVKVQMEQVAATQHAG